MRKPARSDRRIPESEWNFKDHPNDNEKLDCLYYELGRESSTFRKQWEMHRKSGTNPAPVHENSSIAAVESRTRFTTKLSFPDFCARYQPLLRYYPQRPWLELPEKLRQLYSSADGIVTKLQNIGLENAFMDGDQLMQNNLFIFADMIPRGLEIRKCTFNWNHCDDNLIREFTKWIKTEGARIRAQLNVSQVYAKPLMRAHQKGKGNQRDQK